MASGLQRLESERLWDQAFSQLRDALYAGRFEPGSVLSLRTLAETFGTSITPVRDAVARLITLGILERGARNAAVVPFACSSRLRDLTLVRCELEGLAAREAAKRADRTSTGVLEKQLDEMKSFIARGDFGTYLDAHRRFHFQIYAMADIPILSETIENLWLRCGPVLSFVVPEYVRSLKGTDHHAAVVGAIRQGDATTAEAEIVADIQEATAYLNSLADENGRIGRPGYDIIDLTAVDEKGA